MKAGVRCLVMAAMAVASACGAADDPTHASTTGTARVARERSMIKEVRSGEWTPGLTDVEKTVLFAIVEDTLKACVARRELDLTAYTLTETLRKPAATFVTLHLGGRLRGCIGSLAPVAPLYRSVHDNAINAALHDHRFRPVTPSELPLLVVHISVLSPVAPIASPEEFRIGEHGIILEKGRYRSVYLPEVAVEQGWDREATLSSLSEKAGLPAGAWREGARFSVFSSVVLRYER